MTLRQFVEMLFPAFKLSNHQVKMLDADESLLKQASRHPTICVLCWRGLVNGRCPTCEVE